MRGKVAAFAAFALWPVASAWSVQAPAGTELHVRLTNKLSTESLKPKEKVTAVLIAPVVENGKTLLPMGAEVTGIVTESRGASDPKTQAKLGLEFTELQAGAQRLKLNARVAAVDNARETVDETGIIRGLIGSETLTSRIDQGIEKLGQKYGGFADILQAAKGALVKEADPNIAYDPGAEMTLRLTKPLEIGSPLVDPKLAALQPFPKTGDIAGLVENQPVRTMAERPPRPSDLVNLMYIGTREQLESAFREAGWSTAAVLNGQSKFETAIAIIEQRGYKEAPVSTLLLDGRPPDMVYQKGNNTFAQRHHLRIWRSRDTFQGEPVWLCSATHDVGIDYSERDMTFIHRIDPNIDGERTKVVNDLLFTGKVRAYALLDRSNIPQDATNATGDPLTTDGKIAVVLFQ